MLAVGLAPTVPRVAVPATTVAPSEAVQVTAVSASTSRPWVRAWQYRVSPGTGAPDGGEVSAAPQVIEATPCSANRSISWSAGEKSEVSEASSIGIGASTLCSALTSVDVKAVNPPIAWLRVREVSRSRAASRVRTGAAQGPVSPAALAPTETVP
ncbi:MAG: hypothetical protein AVDCRST_MAG24-548, partial [uncultured Nocardioidaceae bacterium]